MTYALVPIKITDANLVSSSIPEPAPGEIVWASDAPYLAGDIRISTTTHRRYKSLQAHTNKSPEIAANIGVYWSDDGPTIRWAMFDGSTSYQSSAEGSITVVFKPGFFGSIYFGGLAGVSLAVMVRASSGGAVIHSSTTRLEGSRPDNMREYCFMPFSRKTDHLITGIAPYSQAEVTVVLTGSGTVKCGIVGAGSIRSMGDTQYGAKASPKNYSTVTIKNGVATIVERRSGNDLDLTCWLKLSEANKVHTALMDLIKKPCLWIGSDLDNYRGLRSWGLGAGSISYDYPQDVQVKINVTGLIK